MNPINFRAKRGRVIFQIPVITQESKKGAWTVIADRSTSVGSCTRGVPTR